jgi:hypothetical protein
MRAAPVSSRLSDGVVDSFLGLQELKTTKKSGKNGRT